MALRRGLRFPSAETGANERYMNFLVVLKLNTFGYAVQSFVPCHPQLPGTTLNALCGASPKDGMLCADTAGATNNATSKSSHMHVPQENLTPILPQSGAVNVIVLLSLLAVKHKFRPWNKRLAAIAAMTWVRFDRVVPLGAVYK